MELVIYLGKKVYISLKNSYYYEGFVLDADKESITLKDKFGKIVSLSKDFILSVREVSL